MQWIYTFSTPETPELAAVGGKGLSLIQTTRRGLPVPAGFALSVTFFAPWLETLRTTPEWKQAVDVAGIASTPEAEFQSRCDALKARCGALALDDEHAAALAQATQALNTPLFAVRSSSPEEDLEGASFAGGYETVLGVTPDRLLAALRRAFASCLDARVFLYKREHGFAVTQPRIAVVVQRQIASEIAGVAFSLNPLTNDYDEVVINANFGLGESVVGGTITPDTFVVDKVRRAIVERQIGKKETSVWLDETGGTRELPAPHREDACLDESQLLQVSDLAMQVERAYDKPMDIEWAFAGGEIYLLQARPITGYFPLPDALLTAPGEPRHLYWDLTLAKWGMAEPLSPLGTDHLGLTNLLMFGMAMGLDTQEAMNTIRPALEGRVYSNISASIKVQGEMRGARELKAMDSASSAILDGLSKGAYRLKKTPPELRGMMFKVIGKMLKPIGGSLQALRNPEHYEQRYLHTLETLRRDMAAIEPSAMSLRELARRTMERLIVDFNVFIPVIIAAGLARTQLERMFRNDPPAIRDLVAQLDRALPHNETIAMGLEMVRLARFPEIAACASADDLIAGLHEGTFSAEFAQAWERFIAQYGMRCPMEMDPATPRPSEHPEQLFAQLRTLLLHPAQNPQTIYERGRDEREQAHAELLEIARKRGKANRFEKNYRILTALAGFRDTPKYCMIQFVDIFRRRALAVGQELAAAERLDTPAQIFDLYFDDIENALADPALDLRALARKNTHYLRRYAHSREFPRLIDSRGRIPQAPRKETRAGEMAGVPISPGVVRGPVKVLHTSNEKPVLPGDILVTRATDPGWTPLFINAAGVVLEVGGVLQHGALVAREYGKPCVAGIEGVTKLLKDGQMVEVDGANGTVRWL